MLAKSREEIIYLRSKNNRQKNKNDELKKKYDEALKKNHALNASIDEKDQLHFNILDQ